MTFSGVVFAFVDFAVVVFVVVVFAATVFFGAFFASARSGLRGRREQHVQFAWASLAARTAEARTGT